MTLWHGRARSVYHRRCISLCTLHSQRTITPLPSESDLARKPEVNHPCQQMTWRAGSVREKNRWRNVKVNVDLRQRNNVGRNRRRACQLWEPRMDSYQHPDQCAAYPDDGARRRGFCLFGHEHGAAGHHWAKHAARAAAQPLPNLRNSSRTARFGFNRRRARFLACGVRPGEGLAGGSASSFPVCMPRPPVPLSRPVNKQPVTPH